MSIEQDENEERPCLHCLIVELIDQFFADYPTSTSEPDVIDADEVIVALAKTVAELTSTTDGGGRQKMIELLKREIMIYDAEFRQDNAIGETSSHARH